jgi:hypothetical protein
VDLDTYDRLSVLLVELRRIVRDGRSIDLATLRRTYDTSALAAELKRF